MEGLIQNLRSARDRFGEASIVAAGTAGAYLIAYCYQAGAATAVNVPLKLVSVDIQELIVSALVVIWMAIQISALTWSEKWKAGIPAAWAAVFAQIAMSLNLVGYGHITEIEWARAWPIALPVFIIICVSLLRLMRVGRNRELPLNVNEVSGLVALALSLPFSLGASANIISDRLAISGTKYVLFDNFGAELVFIELDEKGQPGKSIKLVNPQSGELVLVGLKGHSK